MYATHPLYKSQMTTHWYVKWYPCNRARRSEEVALFVDIVMMGTVLPAVHLFGGVPDQVRAAGAVRAGSALRDEGG